MLGSAWRWLQNLGARNCPRSSRPQSYTPLSPRLPPHTPPSLPPARLRPPLPGSAGFSCSDSSVAPAPSWLPPGFGPFCSPDTPLPLPPPLPSPRPPPPLPAPARAPMPPRLPRAPQHSQPSPAQLCRVAGSALQSLGGSYLRADLQPLRLPEPSMRLAGKRNY